MSQNHVQIAGAYVVATAALLHSCWSRSDHHEELFAAKERASDALQKAEKATQNANDADHEAKKAQEMASEAQARANVAYREAIHDGDKVKMRDCDEWLGDRRCKLVK